ncbi:hypothetical protein Vretimale_6344 [Volvox reticuliferus]|uniref:Uncharacterized protein n=1 Tax=Volvox reticuliferus TaxID=1737510 RepID=A0A8J4G7I3_9CHLO|nr:hypothetical protein Vretimale_6344 [Volvox reticuliferus]
MLCGKNWKAIDCPQSALKVDEDEPYRGSFRGFDKSSNSTHAAEGTEGLSCPAAATQPTFFHIPFLAYRRNILHPGLNYIPACLERVWHGPTVPFAADPHSTVMVRPLPDQAQHNCAHVSLTHHVIQHGQDLRGLGHRGTRWHLERVPPIKHDVQHDPARPDVRHFAVVLAIAIDEDLWGHVRKRAHLVIRGRREEKNTREVQFKKKAVRGRRSLRMARMMTAERTILRQHACSHLNLTDPTHKAKDGKRTNGAWDIQLQACPQFGLKHVLQ